MGAALIGRDEALEAISRAVEGAADGLRVVEIEGDAGIGKTAVWRAAVAAAANAGHTVLTCTPAQSETRMPYGGLGDLFETVPERVTSALPAPQHRALAVALLREDAGTEPLDPRATGMAVRNSLECLAQSGVVVVAIDDHHWFDAPSARALEFAVRRLTTVPVMLLLARRAGLPLAVPTADIVGAVPEDRVTRLRLGPLDPSALTLMLRGWLPRIGPAALSRICDASGGNPLYAIELARSDAQSGGVDRSVPIALADVVTLRMRGFPPDTVNALLRASAQARPVVTDPAEIEVLGPAEEAGFVTISSTGRITFEHPLYAAAVYQAAGVSRRRRLHAELAAHAATLEQRATHLALATVVPDEDVADEIERSAHRVLTRGALDDALVLFEHSLRLTPPEPAGTVWRRRLALGRCCLLTGELDRAREATAPVQIEAPPSPVRAHALQLLGEIAVTTDLAAGLQLFAEALACPDLDPQLAIELELLLAMGASAQVDLEGELEHARRARSLLPEQPSPALLAKVNARLALADVHSTGHFNAKDVEVAMSLAVPEPTQSVWTWTLMALAYVHIATADFDIVATLLERIRTSLEGVGEITERPWIDSYLAMIQVHLGDVAGADAHAANTFSLLAMNDQGPTRAAALRADAHVAVARGEIDRARQAADEATAIAKATGWVTGVGEAAVARAYVALHDGDPAAALAMLEPALAVAAHTGSYDPPFAFGIPDAIEAMVQLGDLDRADALCEAAVSWGRTRGRSWSVAVGERGRSSVLVARGDLAAAAEAIDAALTAHESQAMPLELARTLIAGGRIARRSGRRRDARAMFARARDVAEAAGADLWREQADAELGRLGTRRAPDGLTQTELRIAELAAAGMTNIEIAAQVFISRRTVEANLARIYRKLGIRSRAQLSASLAAAEGTEAAADQ